MREYVITVTFVDGKMTNHTTEDQHFAQQLVSMFVKHDKVVNVQIKRVRGKED